MKLFRFLMSLAMAACLLPVASVILSAMIAGYMGCQLDEGGVHPCVIAGYDYGETLAMMFVSGWFALLTLPVLLVMLPVWIVREILHRQRKPGRGAADS